MKMDQPPKNKQDNSIKTERGMENQRSIDFLEKDFKIYEKKRYISPKNFKEKFGFLIKNSEFFNKYRIILDNLLNESIDEMSIIEWNNEYTDESDKKIEKLLDKKIGSYLNSIFSLYENGSFSEKIMIISFLSDFHLSAIFSNNQNSRNRISEFFQKKLETEKGDSGNYYIYLHLSALAHDKESLEAQVSPNQFVHEKFVYSKDGDSEGVKNGKHQLFISRPNDFAEIEHLNKSINFKDEKDKEIVEKYKKFESFFVQPLNEAYFRPYAKKDKEENNFLDYKFFQYRSIRDEFKNKAGFALEETSLPEQYNFFEYTKEITNKESNSFFEFLNKYGKDAFRTFLSIEQGGKEMGDKILTLGERLPENVAQKVFSKYGEIIDNVNKIVEFSQHNFKEEIKTSPELIRKIEETLFIKGKQLLSQIYNDINSGKEVNTIEIEKQLDRINADTITTFAIFKQAVKNGEELPIESIEGSVFSKKEAREISNEQQEEMLDLYEVNWKNHPDRGFVVSLKEYFKTAFTPMENQQKNHFYAFEKDEKIRAFVRFEKKEDHNLYASALNVDEASKNFGLGEAMMDEALAREAKENILHASCRKDNPSNMRYFEKGFISRGFKNTSNTEEFDLVWDELKNKDILAKNKTVDELVAMHLSAKYEGSIEIKKADNLNELHKEIPSGKSLVRCFQNPLNKNEWYAVYEKVGDDYGVKEGETK